MYVCNGGLEMGKGDTASVYVCVHGVILCACEWCDEGVQKLKWMQMMWQCIIESCD